MGARYYDPQLGRFTQPDPSGQETNPYLYTGGDPINRTDPNGLLSPTGVADALGPIGDLATGTWHLVQGAGPAGPSGATSPERWRVGSPPQSAEAPYRRRLRQRLGDGSMRQPDATTSHGAPAR
ncbi:RHS repeat-associated core domain-containing protein [Streptomyces sp. TLI_55]|uniref:RHS repeat-associated core domain-containing protein n=1 Tax=Streptomyces sp. TLI_55 TaxID=1938861 RepID=UPI00359C7DB2